MTMNQTETTAQIVADFMQYKTPVGTPFPNQQSVREWQDRFRNASDSPRTRSEMLTDPEFVSGAISDFVVFGGLAPQPDLLEAGVKMIRKGQTARQDALDEAWRAVDAEGGVGMTDAEKAALDAATSAVQRLGGRDAEPKLANMRNVLRVCDARFQEYAATHRAKGTDDALMEAQRNYEMAQMCQEALR
jgi:hypothetical protein